MGAGPLRLQKRRGEFKPSPARYRLCVLWVALVRPTAGSRRLKAPSVVAFAAMAFTAEDEQFMKEALAFARIAYSEQEVPVGAVLVRGGKMIGRGRNRREALSDPTHHAEIEAIREGARAAGTWRLEGSTLYATVEPCPM